MDNTSADEDLAQIEIELGRIADMLDSMPLHRAEASAPAVHDLAQSLLARTRTLSGDAPAESELPRLGPTGLGPMVRVLGRDYVEAARAAPAPTVDTASVLSVLVAARRALP